MNLISAAKNCYDESRNEIQYYSSALSQLDCAHIVISIHRISTGSSAYILFDCTQQK